MKRRRNDPAFFCHTSILLLSIESGILVFLTILNKSYILGIVSFLSLMILLLISYASINVNRRTQAFSRGTSTLSHKLAALANGEREVNFFIREPSEFNEIAQAAELLQYELDKNEKERIRWSSDITHDLRTPISAMKIQLEGMRDGVLSTTDDRYRLLFKEISELENMLSDFSLLNRIETPDMFIQMEWLSSEEIMSTLYERFNIQAVKRGITLKAHWDSFYFKADSTLFIRAASNLIQNALSYTSGGSDVQLSFKLFDNMIQLIVENPGNIPEEELPLLFQRLYRGESSRTTSGTGLGLTIAKSIAQLHQGDIQAMNSNRGTTQFIMTINMILS